MLLSLDVYLQDFSEFCSLPFEYFQRAFSSARLCKKNSLWWTKKHLMIMSQIDYTKEATKCLELTAIRLGVSSCLLVPHVFAWRAIIFFGSHAEVTKLTPSVRAILKCFKIIWKMVVKKYFLNKVANPETWKFPTKKGFCFAVFFRRKPLRGLFFCVCYVKLVITSFT